MGEVVTAYQPRKPAGEDPSYDDDFQQIREEVNKLSGADTDLICSLVEKLLSNTAKDIRVATYYIWARLQRRGKADWPMGLSCWQDYCNAFPATSIHGVTAVAVVP